MSTERDTADLQRRAAALAARIKAWSEDDKQGYDRAIKLLSDAGELLAALSAGETPEPHVELRPEAPMLADRVRVVTPEPSALEQRLRAVAMEPTLYYDGKGDALVVLKASDVREAADAIAALTQAKADAIAERDGIRHA